MRVKALQDWYVAQEGVAIHVRKHNRNLKNEHEKYKEALCSLNGELKEVREKLEEEGRQKGKLEEELSTLRGQGRRQELTPSGSSRHRNHSLTFVLNIMALGLRTALNRLCPSTQTWIYPGLPWMIPCHRHLLETPSLARVMTLSS